MNLVLVSQTEVSAGVCTLRDERAQHLRTFLHAAPGSRFRVGLVDGLMGVGEVLSVSPEAVTFRVMCDQTALPPWYDLVLALPRPRSFKRILFQSAAMGVRNIFVTGAAKVEKSYFSMHLLRPEEYGPVLLEGLMQGATTALPQVRVIPRFRDLFSALPADAGLRIIANPAPAGSPLPASGAPGVPLIAVGPDGGWTEAENAAFAAHGFIPFTLGPRPLRTDTAAIALPAVIQDRLTQC